MDRRPRVSRTAVYHHSLFQQAGTRPERDAFEGTSTGHVRGSRTNHRYLNHAMPGEIVTAAGGDPGAAPLDIDWAEALLIKPSKVTAVAIGIDPNVLDDFEFEAPGRPCRTNAVLRSHGEQRQKRGKPA